MGRWRDIGRGREGGGATEYMLGVALVVLVMVASLSLLVPYLQRGLLGLGHGLRTENYENIGTYGSGGGGTWSPGASPYWQSGQDGYSWVGGEDKLGIAGGPASINPPKEPKPKIALSAMDYFKFADFDTALRDKNIPGNWQEVNVAESDYDQYGITPEMFESNWMNGFHAKLYYNPDTNQYVCAFEDTDRTSIPDWINNLAQGAGLVGPQYEQAMDLAEALDRMATAKGADLEFVGYSLGGGLASAASLVTDRKASTYNAAGLNSSTVNGRGGIDSYSEMHEKGAQLIKSYFVKGDPLSTLQDNPDNDSSLIIIATRQLASGAPLKMALGAAVLVNAAKNNGDVIPKAVGQRIELEAPSGEPGGKGGLIDSLDLHYKPAVYYGLGKLEGSHNLLIPHNRFALRHDWAEDLAWCMKVEPPDECPYWQGGWISNKA